MPVTIVPINSQKALRAFINLPESIHREHANWLPPLYMDEWAFFNPKKNKGFRTCDTTLLLAYRDGKPLGRIMGIIDRRHNEQYGEKTVRFSHFDCFEDAEAATALLSAIEQWGREKGMTEIVGPFGFSDKDPQGLMIEGFEEWPVMVTNCNMPYLPGLVETAGYGKKLDLLDYQINLNNGVPAFFSRLYERVRKDSSYQVMEFRSTRELKPYITPVFHLINETYRDIYGFLPLDDREIAELVSRYLPILDPRFVKVVLNPEKKLVAFVVALPNMTAGIQRARGRLLPFGFIHILRSAKTTRQLDLMLGAIHPDYRGIGLDVLMGWKIIESARAAGMDVIETHLVLETNTRMRREYEHLQARLHKRFRIYSKDL